MAFAIDRNNAGISFHVNKLCHELKNAIRKVYKIFFELLRSIIAVPFVIGDVIVSGSKVRWFNLRASSALQPSKNEPKKDFYSNFTMKTLQLIPDPTESYKIKKQLIENAKFSLDISSYCGGIPFTEFLEIIEKKLKNNNEFKVRIISNFYMINQKEKEILSRLMKIYPKNFEILRSRAVFGVFPKLRRHENHTKMLIADQKYFIAGGTCMSNRLLKQGTVKAAGGACDYLSDGNRDIDLFGEGKMAEKMKESFDHMWSKWKILLGIPKNPFLDMGRHLNYVADEDRMQLPKSPNAVENVSCDFMVSHPEEGKENVSLKSYLKAINEARSNIYISNMIFNHEKVINSIIKALKRGVNITIITNGDHKDASFAAKWIGPRNRVHYRNLLRAAQEPGAGKCELYEFSEKEVLLHSKAMIIDRNHEGGTPLLFVGSYNISKESAGGDEEHLIIVRSKELAEKAFTCFEFFKQNSIKISEKIMNEFDFRKSCLKGRILNITLKRALN